jgi:hypothetical protein
MSKVTSIGEKLSDKQAVPQLVRLDDYQYAKLDQANRALMLSLGVVKMGWEIILFGNEQEAITEEVKSTLDRVIQNNPAKYSPIAAFQADTPLRGDLIESSRTYIAFGGWYETHRGRQVTTNLGRMAMAEANHELRPATGIHVPEFAEVASLAELDTPLSS